MDPPPGRIDESYRLTAASIIVSITVGVGSLVCYIRFQLDRIIINLDDTLVVDVCLIVNALVIYFASIDGANRQCPRRRVFSFTSQIPDDISNNALVIDFGGGFNVIDRVRSGVFSDLLL